MGRLFSLYSRREFNNTCTIWLKSVCHYISKGYAHVTEEILKLMGTVREREGGREGEKGRKEDGEENKEGA